MQEIEQVREDFSSLTIFLSLLQLQIALHQAEEHAQNQSYEPSNELIDLLKRTYNMEEIAFEVKRKLAETALITAKDQVNKNFFSFSIDLILDEQDFQDAKRFLRCCTYCTYELHR